MNMIASARSLWKRLFPRQKVFVLFVPCAEHGRSDAVATLAPLIRQELSRADHLIVDPLQHSHFGDLLNRAGIHRVPNRIVLFAHPTAENHAFAANAHIGGTAAIHAPWWSKEYSKYDLLIAHVCRGAVVLDHEPYRSVFPSWVSYRDDIRLYLGSQTARSRWVKVCASIVQAVADSSSTKGVHHRIREVYEHAMAETADTYSRRDGDLLNLGYFQSCLESLRASDH